MSRGHPVVTRLVLAVTVLLLTACSPAASQSQSTTSGFPPVLSIENRGGPRLYVSVNGSDVATVGCNEVSTIAPGRAGVPDLPWTLSIVRELGTPPIFTGEITALPRWYLQVGETSLGVGSTPPIGPAVTCPPR
jgi:hypothetical protein